MWPQRCGLSFSVLQRLVIFFTEVDLCVVGRVARMETEAIDIEAEQRKANERIRQIGAQKARQLDDLSSRAQVHDTHCQSDL